MKKLFLILGVACLMAGLTSCKKEAQVAEASLETEQAGGQEAVVDNESERDIVKLAVATPDLTTLVTAVKAGDLVTALSNAGPFTVFAPVNSAFEKLPAGTVEGLLEKEKLADLQDILQYHVAVAVYKTEDLTDGRIIGQANGGNVTISVKDGKTYVNDAQIIGSVKASNGVVHLIDGVLLPKK